MKRIYQILVLAILVILNTSCLKSGLDELETYNLTILPMFVLNTDGGMNPSKECV